VASHTRKCVLDYIHSDVWRPITISSNGGAYYFVSFIQKNFLSLFYRVHVRGFHHLQAVESASEKSDLKKNEKFEIR
jgi:hypothetical protein